MKKTVLFDLDGTLIDSTEAILEGFKTSFLAHKTKPPHESDITRLVGFPLDIMFARLGVSEEIVHSFVDAYKRHYRIIATEKTTLLPNAKEAVVKASEFARVGVVTTKTRAYSMEILEHLGIGKYFETVVGRECVQNPKPHPEPVLVALERMKLKKDGVFLIGDTMLDLLASKDASIEFVGVCGKYEDMDIFKKECKVLKKDALDAVYYIKKRKI